ncbi:hypothetical protein S7335_3116 [Synechococcus sp. PCC 7335]|nr:hypothetical protein S7335_3116 [Synechococcus sp. PCC 7335]
MNSFNDCQNAMDGSLPYADRIYLRVRQGLAEGLILGC